MSFQQLLAKKGLLGGKYTTLPTKSMEEEKEEEMPDHVEESGMEEERVIEYLSTPKRTKKVKPRKMLSPLAKEKMNTYAGKIVKAALEKTKRIVPLKMSLKMNLVLHL